MRQEGSVEEAFQDKNYKGNKQPKQEYTCFSTLSLLQKNNNNHPHKSWWSPNAKCQKCGQLGHEDQI